MFTIFLWSHMWSQSSQKYILNFEMEKEQAALMSFVNLHGRKAQISSARQIHLVKYNESGIPLDVTLECLTLDDVVKHFDTNDRRIQWVLNQIQTYNTDKEAVIGLQFPERIILSHVIRLKK